MVDSEKFVDEIKRLTLYQAKESDSIPSDMLKEWRANQRFNEKMARYNEALNNLFSTYHGEYAHMFDEFMPSIVTTFRSLDGWSVEHAIVAEGQKAMKVDAEQKKGFLSGIFNGGGQK